MVHFGSFGQLRSSCCPRVQVRISYDKLYNVVASNCIDIACHSFVDGFVSLATGFMGDVAGAWRALDSDLSGSITLQEVDKEFLGVILQRASACRIMQAYTRYTPEVAEKHDFGGTVTNTAVLL